MAYIPTSPGEVVVGTLQRDIGHKHSLGEKVEGRGKASCKKLYLPLSFGPIFFLSPHPVISGLGISSLKDFLTPLI